MTKEDILRLKPWLKLCNVNSISDRISEQTNGNAFVVFNLIQQNYELHTIEAQKLSGDSYNTTLELDLLNGFLLRDYKIHNNKTNGEEVLSDRRLREHLYDKHEKNRTNRANALDAIERVIGTKI